MRRAAGLDGDGSLAGNLLPSYLPETNGIEPKTPRSDGMKSQIIQ